MLDARYLRENLEKVRERLLARSDVPSLGRFAELDVALRDALREVEALKNKRNVASEEIGRLKKEGVAQDILDARAAEMKGVSTDIKKLDDSPSLIAKGLRGVLYNIPNIPHESVPVGRSDRDNIEVKRWGSQREFSFTPRPHWEV